MILPYLYLNAQRSQKIEKALELIDTYEFPTGTGEESIADLTDCIDEEDGTFNF